MPFTIVVKHKDRVYSGANIGRVEVNVPMDTEAFNVNLNKTEKATWFEVTTEARAKVLAEFLAASNPGAEVVICEQKLIYQSEKPKVNSKEVSDRGVLPF